MRQRNGFDKSEFLKTYFGNPMVKENLYNEPLAHIGQVWFYKLKPDYRVSVYNRSFYDVSTRYSAFIDNYFTKLKYISNLLINSTQLKINEFNSLLSVFDVLLIFYFFMQNLDSESSYLAISKVVDFDKLIDNRANLVMFDLPSDEEIRKEIKLIKSLTADNSNFPQNP